MNKDFTIEKSNWTVTFNDIFTVEIDGKKLSPEAWGLYVFMLSLPENWDYTVAGLMTVVNAGRDKINRILNELENYGFLIRTQSTKSGRFSSMKYTILQRVSTPFTEKPFTEEPITDFKQQQNTNKQIDIDKLKIKGEIPPVIAKHFLTLELINKKFISALDYDLERYDLLFTELDKSHGIKLVLNATRYLLKTIPKNKKYEADKFSYFEASITNNLIMLESRN